MGDNVSSGILWGSWWNDRVGVGTVEVEGEGADNGKRLTSLVNL